MGITWARPAQAKPLHLVLFAYEAWGHTRPLCNLAIRLIQARSIYVTFFTTPSLLERVKKELRRSLDDEDDSISDNIRVVALRHEGVYAFETSVLESSFTQAYEMLAKGETIACTHTGTLFEPISCPDAVIIDFYARPLLASVRRITEHVKVFVWFAGAASAIFRFCGPEDKGGVGNLRDKSEAEAARSGMTPEAAAGEISLGVRGAVVEIPGLPAMYDYEFQPQEILGGRGLIGGMMLSAYDVFTACNGVILATPEWYEPEAIATLREWFASTSRGVYTCGPMVPHGKRADVIEGEQAECTTTIMQFLQSARETYGDHSVLYMSLGTIYWPSEPGKVWAFLDVVMDLQIPFIFSFAAKRATVPESVVQKVNDYGKGVITNWSPQQLILEHPATGWFVTHGGQNSVIEAISAGVPMICWPFSFDQPMNAANLSNRFDVAYELFEIRDGPGLMPIRRTGRVPTGSIAAVRAEARDVLQKAFGMAGERKRSNMQCLKHRILDELSRDGPSRQAVETFLDSISCEARK